MRGRITFAPVMVLWVNDTNALDRARQLMADLQSAARAKDLAAALTAI